MLLLIKLTKSNTLPWVFLTFLKLYKWYQIAQHNTYIFAFPILLELQSWNIETEHNFAQNNILYITLSFFVIIYFQSKQGYASIDSNK